MKLGFGKYRGEAIEDIPLDYLKWVDKQDWVWSTVKEAIQHEIKRRESNITSLGKTTELWRVAGDKLYVNPEHLKNLDPDTGAELFERQVGQSLCPPFCIFEDNTENRILLRIPPK